MSRFTVLQDDPHMYRSQILAFWKAYLPDTPPERFEWMTQGNPAGPSLWFFATDKKSGELAGTLSVMPVAVFNKGKELRAGILGDFMIANRYRAFGPAIQLPKTVLEALPGIGMDFVYTIPNDASESIFQRIGFRSVGVLGRYVKPLDSSYFLSKRTISGLQGPMSFICNLGLRFLSRETYIWPKGFVEEKDSFDASTDGLIIRMEEYKSGMIGKRDSAYLNWRYFHNTCSGFRVLNYQSSPGGLIHGYVIYRLEEKRLEVHDLVAVNRDALYQLLKRITNIARNHRCVGIYMRAFEHNPFVRHLSIFRFFNSNDDMNILFWGKEDLSIDRWIFSSGDRNI